MTSSEYRLPQLPLGRSEVTLLRWLKRAGDQVAATDALLIVANDRLEVVLPAGRAGVLDRQHVAEGAGAAAGALLATFAAAPQPVPGRSLEPPRRVTPVARQVAAARGIAIEHLAGSGASGRVTKADVLAARGSGIDDTHRLPDQDRVPFIVPARALVPAARADLLPETHALTAFEVDLERVAALRARLSADWARRGLACTDALCVAAAVVAALPAHPLLNATWRDEYIIQWRQIDLALLSGVGRVVVAAAHDLNLRGLARAIQRGRASAIANSTFTIIEGGPSLWCGLPALADRQNATLALGAAHGRAVVVAERGADRVAVRRTGLLTLAYDARALDQGYADAFLRDLKERLEHFDG